MFTNHNKLVLSVQLQNSPHHDTAQTKLRTQNQKEFKRAGNPHKNHMLQPSKNTPCPMKRWLQRSPFATFASYLSSACHACRSAR